MNHHECLDRGVQMTHLYRVKATKSNPKKSQKIQSEENQIHPKKKTKIQIRPKNLNLKPKPTPNRPILEKIVTLALICI